MGIRDVVPSVNRGYLDAELYSKITKKLILCHFSFPSSNHNHSGTYLTLSP